MGKSINSNLNTRSTCTVLEGVDPVPLDLGHLGSRERTVSHGIHAVE